MTFGLRQRDTDEIVRALQKFPSIREATIFGSRAKGNHKPGSDVDIAIKGESIDHSVVASLAFALNEESSSPYFFDVVHFEALSEHELIAHINRVGKRIYVQSGLSWHGKRA